MTGISITLKSKTQDGTDEFNQPIWKDTDITIDDVLVGEPSTDDIQSNLTAYGVKVSYTLAIPKGDTHTWANNVVVLPEPFGGTYKVIGDATAGIEANIPLRWNKKVYLERLEG